jgi:hypothetical protein
MSLTIYRLEKKITNSRYWPVEIFKTPIPTNTKGKKVRVQICNVQLFPDLCVSWLGGRRHGGYRIQIIRHPWNGLGAVSGVVAHRAGGLRPSSTPLDNGHPTLVTNVIMFQLLSRMRTTNPSASTVWLSLISVLFSILGVSLFKYCVASTFLKAMKKKIKRR